MVGAFSTGWPAETSGNHHHHSTSSGPSRTRKKDEEKTPKGKKKEEKISSRAPRNKIKRTTFSLFFLTWLLAKGNSSAPNQVERRTKQRFDSISCGKRNKQRHFRFGSLPKKTLARPMMDTVIDDALNISIESRCQWRRTGSNSVK